MERSINFEKGSSDIEVDEVVVMMHVILNRSPGMKDVEKQPYF